MNNTLTESSWLKSKYILYIVSRGLTELWKIGIWVIAGEYREFCPCHVRRAPYTTGTERLHAGVQPGVHINLNWALLIWSEEVNLVLCQEEQIFYVLGKKQILYRSYAPEVSILSFFPKSLAQQKQRSSSRSYLVSSEMIVRMLRLLHPWKRWKKELTVHKPTLLNTHILYYYCITYVMYTYYIYIYMYIYIDI